MNQKLEALRARMRERGIDAYLVPTADFHESEYVSDHFKCREYLSGFTGSAATVVVTMDEAGLWTDGRYFVQAAKELEGSGITLFRMGQEGVPTVMEYIGTHVPAGGILGFDGRVVNRRMGEELKAAMAKKNACVACDMDLVGEIWENRPALPGGPVWVLDMKYAGKTAAEKLRALREDMEKAGAGVHILTTLDDIAWLLNLRGNDIECTPTFISYMMVTAERAVLYINEDKLDENVRAYLAGEGVRTAGYGEIYKDAAKLHGETVLLEKEKVNYRLCDCIPEDNAVISRMNPTSLRKAAKNPVEVENTRRAHIKDGVAVTRFICWLKKNIGKIPMDEILVDEKLTEFKKQQEGFLGLSFKTIAAYGSNAAMCHYKADEKNCRALEPRGFLLVDAGSQYLEGTTDMTRTIALGPLSKEESECFTLVLCSMLRLADAKFLHGCSGMNLDYVARELFWRRGLDFNHGTGHGVGYLSGVHERPNGFRWRVVPERQDSAVLEEGMVTSDEPGLYFEGKFGIRTENLLVCLKDYKNEYGQFMKFEHLTFCPIDLDAIDVSLMEPRDKELLNEYHRAVYEKISPYLDGEEKEWLKEATRPVA